jgi:hypothetical protein
MNVAASDNVGGKTWHVRVDIAEHGRETRAVAHLDTGAGTDLTGRGVARTHPADPLVPEIGDELAAARALSELAHCLLDVAAGDVAAVAHDRAWKVE